MQRIVFNELEKLVSQDITNVQKALYQNLCDRFIYSLLNEAASSFLNNSFLCERASDTELTVRNGIGFYFDNTQTGFEPKYRPLFIAEDITLTLGGADPAWTAAHATLDRIDIIVVRPKEEVTDTEVRFVKTEAGGSIVSQEVDKLSELTYEIDAVEGTPDASPVAPATPAGWIKIAEIYVTAVTGIVSDGDVTDSRTKFAPANSSSIQPDTVYVSPSGNGTHTNLASAVADLPAGGGSVILMEDLSISSTITLPDDVMVRGISNAVTLTFEAGGKLVLGDRCRVTNMIMKTTEAALNPMVDMDGDYGVIDHVIFDLPASQTNTAIEAAGSNPEVNNCIFLNADGTGTETNTSINVTSTTLGSLKHSDSLQGRVGKVISVSTTHTMKARDTGMLHNCDSSGGAFNFTLPACQNGLIVRIKDETGDFADEAVTLVPDGSDTIEGIAANFVLDSAFGYWEFEGVGTNWVKR